jgi:hypothetical protein
MKIIFLFNGTDPDCLKLAQRLVEQTEAEVRHSDGMQPTLWLDGAIYYGLERIEEVLTKRSDDA